MMISIKRLEGR